ncbi:hypothetical protein BDY17DRAFT_91406 [Neohortaea acidophila]|uniref:Uncharacterized protein n=1 Tax=Neohortaea acidophila TaxID=245834 RepID=A0A6A6PET6_9PEZI|nr:uncharacterized protein BDY17DRAFT_91406 [Neohortaea acidophila]KAF2478442.1 hypothetical protein BDY17DRAFT_91406 [Neohortaea acidophila]
MTRSIDRRRPRCLNEDQLAEVCRHPEVKLLLRVRTRLAKRIRAEYGTISRTKGTKIYKDCNQAYRAHQSKKKAVAKVVLAQVKASWRKRQPLLDIANQLDGGATQKLDLEGGAVDPLAVLCDERFRAFTPLFTFATTDPSEECQRRSEAIEAVTALSRHQEPKLRELCRTRQWGKKHRATRTNMESKAATELFPVGYRATQCIFCLGNAELSIEQRMKFF